MDEEIKVGEEVKKETRGRKPKVETSESNSCKDCKLFGTRACLSCLEYKKENEVKTNGTK